MVIIAVVFEYPDPTDVANVSGMSTQLPLPLQYGEPKPG
jgi:hypothetical protein